MRTFKTLTAMETRKKVRILSLDGGGIRGVIPATIMLYVEQELIKRTNDPNARIADYFDMIVGTSTGGILACYYLTPSNSEAGPVSKYTAEQALSIYASRGGEIFNEAKKSTWLGMRQLFNATRFSPKNIENIFREVFGDMQLQELLKPCIVTTYNMHTGESVFFNSRESADKKEKRRYYVRDVVRSTSAAPTYFPPAQISNLATGDKMVNIDGGVFANNPAMCAFVEANTTSFPELELHEPTAKDMLLLSIGTGSLPLKFAKPSSTAGTWGVIGWAKSIPEIMMDGGLDTVSYQMEQLFGALDQSEDRKNYKRVNIPKSMRKDAAMGNPPYNSDMSDASSENIARLKVAGQKALEEANKPKQGEMTLDQFIDAIIAVGKTSSVREA